MATKAQLAQYCADHFPSQIVNSGISMTHYYIDKILFTRKCKRPVATGANLALFFGRLSLLSFFVYVV